MTIWRSGVGMIIALAAIVPVQTVGLAAEPQSHYALVKNTVETFILPRLAVLDREAAALGAATAQLCGADAAQARDTASKSFAKTVQAWAAVDFLRFGPLIEGGRRERMSFWPDPRGFLDRQLRQALAAQDPKILEAEAFSKQSAALQGLPALEALLNNPDLKAGPDGRPLYPCALAAAVAANIAAMAHSLETDWTKNGGWKDKMFRPGSDNDTYKEPGEAASELVKAALVGLQLAADLQLKPQIEGKSRVSRPFERSGQSRAYYMATVAALHDYYGVMNLESYLPEDKAWIVNWSAGAWRSILASDGAGGAAAAVKPEDAPPVRAVFDRMSGLRKLITSEISAAAGLTIGFNELDGD